MIGNVYFIFYLLNNASKTFVLKVILVTEISL